MHHAIREKIDIPNCNPNATTTLGKCLISCISHLPAILWTFTVWTKEHNRSTFPHIFADSDTENWWDYMHWCHFSTKNKIHTHRWDILYTVLGRRIDLLQWTTLRQVSKHILSHTLEFWELPFVFSKGAGTLEVKYSVIDPDWTTSSMNERAS